jgi:hypothetical protein
VRLIKKYPYKNDASQFIRFFEVEDRGGKMEIGVFEQSYGDVMINEDNKRIRVWQVGNIIIVKVSIDEYKGRKGVKYKSCLKIV